MKINKLAGLVILIFTILCLPSFVIAETIVLKSGKKIEANITARTEEEINIDYKGIPLTYFLDEIETIDGVKAEVINRNQPEATPQINTTQEAITEPVSAKETTVENYTADTVPAQKSEENNENTTQINVKTDSPFKGILPEKLLSDKKAMATFAGLMVFVLFIGLIIYIYCSICLQFIAKKTNSEPAWLAWIPIANYFLMCKIAKVSYWWLLILLGAFIPYVGAISITAFMIFLWYKIAISVNKPGWMGVLTIIPLVNLVIMGYLAFSKDEIPPDAAIENKPPSPGI